MINVATMKTNNVGLILGAYGLNGLVGLLGVIVWLVPAAIEIAARLVIAVVGVVAGALALVVKHWRLLAMVAGLVLAGALVVVFWQAIVIGAGVLGGMYGGLLAVMRS